MYKLEEAFTAKRWVITGQKITLKPNKTSHNMFKSYRIGLGRHSYLSSSSLLFLFYICSKPEFNTLNSNALVELVVLWSIKKP